MHDAEAALNAVRARIRECERRYRREPGSVTLLAVSKTKPPEAVRAAIAAGQHAFGENHLQDAMTKVEALAGHDDFVALHRRRPVEQDPADRGAFQLGPQHRAGEDRGPPLRPAPRRTAEPLDVCIEVNVSGEESKSGVPPAAVEPLARTDPRAARAAAARTDGHPPSIGGPRDSQRIPFRLLREILDDLNAKGLETRHSVGWA